MRWNRQSELAGEVLRLSIRQALRGLINSGRIIYMVRTYMSATKTVCETNRSSILCNIHFPSLNLAHRSLLATREPGHRHFKGVDIMEEADSFD